MAEGLIPRALAEVVVRDVYGNERTLGEAWRERPAVVVWVRHFGCIACRAHVAELRPHLDAIKKRAELVIVGNGNVEQARRFRELMDLQAVPVLSDEALASYRIAGLQRGWWSFLRPSALANWLRLRDGHQRGIRGDVMQQGGTMVIAPSGAVAYKHVSRTWGDNSPARDVLAALERC